MARPIIPQPEVRPTWALVAGLAIGAFTLLFLMFFPLTALFTGKRIDCGDTWWITLVFGLALGLASAFLGGYATVTGDIKLPFLGGQPLATAAIGGIVFVAIGAGLSYLVTSQRCVDPMWVGAEFTDWDYLPDKHSFTLRFQENRIRPENFIPAPDAKNYLAYVGVRKQGAAAPERGDYPVLIGPYQIDANMDITSPLSDGELEKLGTCVDFVLFGVRKTDAANRELTAPFRPGDHSGIQVLERVGYGNCD